MPSLNPIPIEGLLKQKGFCTSGNKACQREVTEFGRRIDIGLGHKR